MGCRVCGNPTWGTMNHECVCLRCRCWAIRVVIEQTTLYLMGWD